MALMVMASMARPLPEPGAVALTPKSGTGPLIAKRQTIVQMAEMAAT